MLKTRTSMNPFPYFQKLRVHQRIQRRIRARRQRPKLNQFAGLVFSSGFDQSRGVESTRQAVVNGIGAVIKLFQSFRITGRGRIRILPNRKLLLEKLAGGLLSQERSGLFSAAGFVQPVCLKPGSQRPALARLSIHVLPISWSAPERSPASHRA